MNRASAPAAVPRPAHALFWRLFLINGALFVVGTLVLALSPATVSSPVIWAEVPVLLVGLTLILAANAWLVRRSLAPLGELTTVMQRADPLRSGERVRVRTRADLAQVAHTFNTMLDRMEAERNASTAHALAAQESERQRISRELHDEIGQSLTAVLLDLQRVIAAAPPELRHELASTQSSVRDTLDEVRHVASRLRPGVLTDLGLHSALVALVDGFTTDTGVPVTRHLRPRTDGYGQEVDLVVYRLVQECLTNVARHAAAQRVTVSVDDDGTTLTVRVVDDGNGGVEREGAGIRGMHERVELVRGRVSLTSPPGGGTDVRAVIPLATGQA